MLLFILINKQKKLAKTLFAINCKKNNKVIKKIKTLNNNKETIKSSQNSHHHCLRLNNNATCNEVPIYNYVSKDNPITYDELKEMSSKYGLDIPPMKAIWYYSFRNTKHKIVHLFYVYLFHLLPALFVDTATVCIGKQPRY